MKPKLFFLILILLLTIPIGAPGTEYYRWTDAIGIIHFADECGIIPLGIFDRLTVSQFPGFPELTSQVRHEEIKYQGNSYFNILYGKEAKHPSLPISEVMDIALTLKQEGNNLLGYAIFKDKEGRQVGLRESVKAKLDFFCGEANLFFHEWRIEPEDFYYFMVAGDKEDYFGVPLIKGLMLPEMCNEDNTKVSLIIEDFDKEITCILTP